MGKNKDNKDIKKEGDQKPSLEAQKQNELTKQPDIQISAIESNEGGLLPPDDAGQLPVEDENLEQWLEPGLVSAAQAHVAEEKAPEIEKVVERVLLKKPFVLSLRMPGRSSGTITRTFTEGQIVYDPEAIAWLIQYDAPIEIL